MTQDLPPLPYPYTVPLYSAEHMREYAQLAIKSANERIAALEKLIDQHNAEIISNCESEYNRNARACEAWTGRGRQCPDCPKDYLIDAIDRAQSGDTK